MISDEKNNKIFKVAKKNGTAFYLHLNKDERARKLWVLKWDTFEIKRDRERHLFLKTNSYWFNDWLLRKLLTPETKIVVKEKLRKLKLFTTVWEILEKWSYLYFLQYWFERQIFLPLSEFTKDL